MPGILRVLSLHTIQYFLVVSTISLTPPSSFLRIALLPLVLACSISILTLIFPAVNTKVQAAFIATNVNGVLLRYIDLALISRWSFGARGPTSGAGGHRIVKAEQNGHGNGNGNGAVSGPAQVDKDESSTSIARRLRWGFVTVAAWRQPGTPWEARGTPPFPDHETTASRTRFVAQRLTQLVACWLVLGAMGLLPATTAQERAETFAWENVAFFARLSEITAGAVAERIVGTVLFWSATYCILQIFYCGVGVIGVATGVTPVRDWPPLFGSVTECFSVRRFWGLFWHQALRQLVGAPATYLTYSVLKLKRSTLVSRYLGILLTFAVSGLYHVGEEYASGLPVERSGAMRFYCTQVFGFVIEDAATALYSRVRREKKAGCWAKVIGFIWTLCWMSWTSPSWFYPKLVANTGTSKDQALPG